MRIIFVVYFYFILFNYLSNKNIKIFNIERGVMGIGDWEFGPIPNPQSPIPNPQSPIPNPHLRQLNYYFNYIIIINK